MFDNIGGKLKSVAKALCWIGIIGSIILAISYFILSNGNSTMITSGFVTLVVGCLGSWVCSLAVYGFGELIDKVVTIDNKLGKKGAYVGDSKNDRKKKLQQLRDEGLITQEEYNERIKM